MPKGPQGQKRPADVIGNAVHVARIATGEIKDDKPHQSQKAKGGRAGGAARARTLSPERRREIARAGASARWGHGG
ncbi:RNA-binding protein [Candidatus Saccharibacteria bacterium]|nr:RNA-binding protein [Candidatus Saccharibacteria bacterium]